VADVVEDVRLGGLQRCADAVERGVLEDVDGHRATGGQRRQPGGDRLPLARRVERGSADRRRDGHEDAYSLGRARGGLARRRLGAAHDRCAGIQREEGVGLGVVEQLPRQRVRTAGEAEHDPQPRVGRGRARAALAETHEHGVGHQCREQRSARLGVVDDGRGVGRSVGRSEGRSVGRGGETALPGAAAGPPPCCDVGPVRGYRPGLTGRRVQDAHVEVVAASRDCDVEVEIGRCGHGYPS
jgi:hypothetical protein